MSPVSSKRPFSEANPHALAIIMEAAETQRIIASTDIFDIQGIKLWARDRPVSAELQRKLVDRQLRQPLESCLRAEDGVSPKALVQVTQELLGGAGPVARVLQPHAGRLLEQVALLPLHSVAQLLLTAARASRPSAFEHSVEAMALAGALMDARGGDAAQIRLALLAGLLHDLGEMYIDPTHGEADADRTLDFQSYQQLVVHPHVGQLLLAQLTDYPKALAQAVAVHHERMDGSGYPHGLQGDRLPELGRMLMAVEAALAVLRYGPPQLARASIALRVVPGEFDLTWAAEIDRLARREAAAPASRDVAALVARLTRLDEALAEAGASIAVLETTAESEQLHGAFSLAMGLLKRLRAGWFASGLWDTSVVTVDDAAEVEAVEDELEFRLRAIERAAWLRAGELPQGDAHRLGLLGQSLRSVVG